jgi:HSP20 family protein
MELNSGLKKEDLHIRVEDDRTLYISYNNQPKEVKEGEEAATDSQSKGQKPSSCSFMRKFKLPENADVEQIKAEFINETLTVTVPKRKMKLAEARRIEISEGATSQATSASTTQRPQEGKGTEKSVRFSTPDASKP